MGFFVVVFCFQALAARSSQRATGWRGWAFASEAALAAGMHVSDPYTHVHVHTRTHAYTHSTPPAWVLGVYWELCEVTQILQKILGGKLCISGLMPYSRICRSSRMGVLNLGIQGSLSLTKEQSNWYSSQVRSLAADLAVLSVREHSIDMEDKKHFLTFANSFSVSITP